MNTSERKVVLYIAMSLDGYIAREDGDLDWLTIVEEPEQDYGYADFISTVDTVILGRKTYDKVLSFGIPFPHQDKKCYVITRQSRPNLDHVIFYTGELTSLINSLKAKPGKNIFIDGGAEIVNELLRLELIDEYIISIIPVMIGSGIRLFQAGRPEMKLLLNNATKFNSGLVQLHYSRESKNTVKVN